MIGQDIGLKYLAFLALSDFRQTLMPKVIFIRAICWLARWVLTRDSGIAVQS